MVGHVVVDIENVWKRRGKLVALVETHLIDVSVHPMTRMGGRPRLLRRPSRLRSCLRVGLPVRGRVDLDKGQLLIVVKIGRGRQQL